MQIVKTVRVKAPIEKVWEVVGDKFGEAGLWASSVYTSTPKQSGKKMDGASCTGRICDTSQGTFSESIVDFNQRSHSVSYVVTGNKMPSFMKKVLANWKLRRIDSNTTEAKMQMDADIAFPFNVLMGWMMKLNFGKQMGMATEELKYFVEKNAQHPRKVKADRTDKAAQARKAALSS